MRPPALLAGPISADGPTYVTQDDAVPRLDFARRRHLCRPHQLVDPSLPGLRGQHGRHQQDIETSLPVPLPQRRRPLHQSQRTAAQGSHDQSDGQGAAPSADATPLQAETGPDQFGPRLPAADCLPTSPVTIHLQELQRQFIDHQGIVDFRLCGGFILRQHWRTGFRDARQQITRSGSADSLAAID